MTQITTNIKGIRDIMRKDTGVDGDAQRISQMVWMLFMKIFVSIRQTPYCNLVFYLGRYISQLEGRS